MYSQANSLNIIVTMNALFTMGNNLIIVTFTIYDGCCRRVAGSRRRVAGGLQEGCRKVAGTGCHCKPPATFLQASYNPRTTFLQLPCNPPATTILNRSCNNDETTA